MTLVYRRLDRRSRPAGLKRDVAVVNVMTDGTEISFFAGLGVVASNEPPAFNVR